MQRGLLPLLALGLRLPELSLLVLLLLLLLLLLLHDLLCVAPGRLLSPSRAAAACCAAPFGGSGHDGEVASTGEVAPPACGIPIRPSVQPAARRLAARLQ